MRATAIQPLLFRTRFKLSQFAVYFTALADERRRAFEDHRILQADLASGTKVRTGLDRYAGQNEVDYWHDYRTAFQRDKIDEIVFRGRYCLDAIKALKVPKVVNFGCLYGWLENELHKLGIAATGVDRSPGTAALNRAEFPGPTFVASDILDFLPGCDLTGGCFAHLNTGTLVLPNVLAEAYRLAHAAGARYVLIFEPNGGSRITGRYFPYSTEPRQSLVFRDGMLLHNYPGLLREAGFRVIRQEFLHPLHPHRDYRSIFFLAERNGEQRL